MVSWPITVNSQSVSSTTVARVGANLGDAPRKCTACRNRDIPDDDPVACPSIENDQASKFRRLTGDDGCRNGSVVEPGAQLEQARQKLVLAADLVEPDVFCLEPLVFCQ